MPVKILWSKMPFFLLTLFCSKIIKFRSHTDTNPFSWNLKNKHWMSSLSADTYYRFEKKKNKKTISALVWWPSIRQMFLLNLFRFCNWEIVKLNEKNLTYLTCNWSYVQYFICEIANLYSMKENDTKFIGQWYFLQEFLVLKSILNKKQ